MLKRAFFGIQLMDAACNTYACRLSLYVAPSRKHECHFRPWWTEHLKKMAGMEPQFIHCCYNNCIAFTGNYAERAECPHCGEDRYVDGNHARKTFVYIPLTRNT